MLWAWGGEILCSLNSLLASHGASEPGSLLLVLHLVQSHTGFMASPQNSAEFPATEGAGAMCCHCARNWAQKALWGLATGQCGRVLVVTNFPSFRLPILQGGTFAFVAPSLAMLSLPAWKCPEWTLNASQVNTSSPEFIEEWQKRIREVTGEGLLG